MREFNDFYEEVIKKDKKELEILKKEETRKVMSILAVLLLSFILFIFFPPYIALVTLIIGIIYIVKVFSLSKDYVGEFKKRVIEKMILEFDGFDRFSPNLGISDQVYKMANFERYDYYSSEDLIDGKLLNKYPVKVAEVHTERESTNSDGYTTRNTIFQGLFSQIEIPIDINGYIHIHSDKGMLGKIFDSKNKIEMDSSEFEKKFDVMTTDKILAMELLTSDVMDTLLNFINQYKIKYEITVIKGNIFIRFKTGSMFEPRFIKKSLEYETLKRYYDTLQFIIKISVEIIKSIERI